MTPHLMIYRNGPTWYAIEPRKATEAAANPGRGWYGFKVPDGPCRPIYNPMRPPGERVPDYRVPADVRAAITGRLADAKR